MKRIQEEKEILVHHLKKEIGDKTEHFQELQKDFFEVKKRVALSAVHSETGEKLTPEEVTNLLRKEKDIQKTLQEFQLLSIRKKHSLDEALDEKTKLGEGSLDYAEYEMMCIETENNIESIQQIKEEIEDIRRKSSNAINILSHLTQKLYVEQSEKVRAEAKEKALKDDLNSMKNKVFVEKTRYSRLKEKNKELLHKSILLQYPELIEDYNSIQKDSEAAKTKVEELKRKYESAMNIIENYD
ncbi:uncharacterized protein LOC129223209 [Uloborus diversus]|uniref:uncharacterized protein LOC129223209 n=1 Tax=Uloborus diversus TaxID=327109 RepID=UPI0024099039|nr:uncharacterized protein LOC129223209 [Uloborus diversus]